VESVASTEGRSAGFFERLLPLRHWLGPEAAANIEQGQARTRLICTFVGLCGFVAIGSYTGLPGGIIATAIVFPLYAVLYAIHVGRHPAPTKGRRAIAVVMDNLVPVFIASSGGPFAAYVGFSFLTTVGWGLRFGRHYLFMAATIPIVAMACNLAASPYWQANLIFGGSIIFGLVANTINASLLLRRIALGNRSLALKMKEIAQLAGQDQLTKLPNRLHFQERLTQTLASAARNRRQAALLLFDIDGFKRVNDTLGHEAGDRLLRELAERVGRRVRAADTFARVGGDEFVVLMEIAHDPSDASHVAESILKAVGEIDLFAEQGLRVGASIGIAYCAPVAGQKSNPDELLRQADRAMYEAKHAGKGCYRFAKIQA
jgi:diguanylate cyclase (GGDEF)-like protein